MTYQATIRFYEPDIGASQYLILQLNATGPESAHHITKQHWKKIRKQIPQATAPRLLRLKTVRASCPRCGATELSFCHHQKGEGQKKDFLKIFKST